MKGLAVMPSAAMNLGCSAVSFHQVARPSGSLGPYYPHSPSGLPFYAASPWSEVANHDLTLRHGHRAEGALLDVHVHVVDAQGAPIAGATVELWNVNARARYVCESGASDQDPGFVGFGRTVTASDGSASFRTPWPVSYSRYLLLRRPPHLHLRVRSGGRDDASEVNVPPTPQAESSGNLVTLTLAP
jgi:protocatechuate 3,4-dioxygenase beta subunit